ncbi:programmed cell death protein 2-like [Tetranychus urticae]|uniref:Programmed cell death protein 2 C-terminal domain-containing protein n=1 Tax=Tetranychus urticae TaxID=32264 RepID=T1KWI8_TETUR|nr:programmed cell death protein 2-like [Tetranychus urticae]
MAHASALVLLGFVDQPIPDESKVEWHTNKIGGKPSFPESIDDGMLINLINDQLICRKCSSMCSLICQIQCSVDESPAFRVIYVFACLQEKCNYFAVTRLMHESQSSVGNQITTHSKHHQIWDTSGWSDDEDNENGEDSNNLFSSSEINRLENSKDTNWKCKFLPKSFDNSLNFKPYYINVENIDDLKSSKLYLTKKELKYCQDEPLTNEDGEKYENPELSTIFGNDKIAYKFYKKLRDFPKQVIRYSWQGQPLLNRSNLNYAIEACENCGSSRKFEFQLMPALISKLNFPPSPSSQSSVDLNYGTVLIYTCSNNCDSKALSEEKCIFLEEVDENVINKK